MGKKQLVLTVLGVIIVGIAITVGINYFHNKSIQLNREAVIKDLNSLATDAQAYYVKLQGEERRDFNGYNIPRKLRSNVNGTYLVISSTEVQLIIQGTGVETQEQNPGCTFRNNKVTYRIMDYPDSTSLKQIY